MFIKKLFMCATLLVSLKCSCNVSNDMYRGFEKINITKVDSGVSRPYSIFEMPSGTGPSTNTTVSLILSPGLQFFHCDMSQTSISSTNVTMAVTLQNRMSVRFSNSTLGQIYTSVYYELIKAAIESTWTTYITSQTSNSTKSIISSKTSGISALIEVPDSELTIAINVLTKFCNLIYELSITDEMIDTAYTNTYNTCTISALTKPSQTSISTNGADSIWALSLYPRQDATLKSGGGRKDFPGCPSGSNPLYDSNIVNQQKTNIDGQEYIKYFHILLLNERSFLLFSASKDSSIKTSMLTTAIDFIKNVSPVHVKKLSQPSVATSFKIAVEYVYDQSNNTSNGLAGYINFGKININSILAAGMLGKITSDNYFSSSFYGSGSGSTIFIFAGQIQYRVSVSYGSITATPATAWSTYTSLISSRYSTSSNNSDFTTHVGIVSELVKHFSPGATNSAASFCTSGLSLIYEDTPLAYLYWMELFYGSFNTLKELRDLNAKTNTEKIAAISTACKTLINSSNCSASKTMCVRIE